MSTHTTTGAVSSIPSGASGPVFQGRCMKLGAKALEGGERSPRLLAAPFELHSTLARLHPRIRAFPRISETGSRVDLR